MRVTILGSGTSMGVPVIGCSCSVCSGSNPKNMRTRASLSVHLHGQSILIDTSPELRLQALNTGLSDIIAVLYTHIHADHTQGFDDLRAFSLRNRSEIDCYLMDEYHQDFLRRFHYAFEDTGYAGLKPMVKLVAMPNQVFQVGSFQIEPIKLAHGHVTTCGFRFNNFAYATDFKSFPEDIVERWKGRIHTMVASGVHFGRHKTHSVIPETINLFRALQVKRGIISHLAHEVDYVTDSGQLPAGVEFAFDGMTIDLESTVS